jgi:hypothetical protein
LLARASIYESKATPLVIATVSHDKEVTHVQENSRSG